MRHGSAKHKLNRTTPHRKAMFRNLAIALFTHGQITTTVNKAKAVQSYVEKLITIARRGDLAARRRVIRSIGDPFLVEQPIDWDEPPSELDGFKVNAQREKIIRGPRVVKKLFDEIAPRFAERPGGYTRVIRIGENRLGDGADLAVLQLVGDETEGPNVSGRFSRRRQKQDRRTAFAAKLRKAGGTAAAGDVEAETDTAVAEPQTEAADTEAATDASVDTSVQTQATTDASADTEAEASSDDQTEEKS